MLRSPAHSLLFVLLSCFLAVPPSAGQTILLEDGFEDGPLDEGTVFPDGVTSFPGIPQTTFTNWNVVQGSVDLLSADVFDEICTDAGGAVKCVDLDGTNFDKPAGGKMETKVAFNLSPEIVRLEFDLAGNQRSFADDTPDVTTVSLGSLFSESFLLAPDAPFQTYTREFFVPTPTAARIVIDHTLSDEGGDNFGNILDNVKLTQLTGLSKEITGGPDLPNRLEPNGDPEDPHNSPDDEIDLAVETNQSETTEYGFTITYSNAEGVETLVLDNVPAKWQVTEVNGMAVIDGSLNIGILTPDGNGGTGDVAVFPKNGRRDNKSSTEIEWRPDPNLFSSTLNVFVETRGEALVFNPKGCGLLLLNKGALALEINPATRDLMLHAVTGEQLPPIFESSALVLASLEDVDGDGIIVRDGSGDEDGDGLTDIQEARDFGNNPCHLTENQIDVLQAIVDANSGTPLADKVEGAIAKAQTALSELTKTPPNNQAAVGNIEGVVGDLEAAIGLDSAQDDVLTDAMDALAGVARQLAADAVDGAIAQGADPGVVSDAQQALADGDALRTSGAFKDAVNKFKDALAKAESVLP